MVELTEYLWIAVFGGILGFAYGFLIGANDVANAFASTVSSKSITLVQAVMIASIFEFSGAFFLGASVTGTIRSKIIDIKLYSDEPEVLMFGMFSALFSANVMLFFATMFGMPVSTTHDIVASILGFSAVAKGFGSIEWDVATKIFMSWFISPLLSGTVSYIFFTCIKYGVMKAPNPFERAFWVFPIVIMIGIGINIFYVLYKGAASVSSLQDKLTVPKTLGWSVLAGGVCCVLWIVVFGPMAKKRVYAARDEANRIQAQKEASAAKELEAEESADGAKKKNESDDTEDVNQAEASEQAIVPSSAAGRMFKSFGDATFNRQLHEETFENDARAAEIWEGAEQYDEDTENLFKYLQVFTACLNSFAHGANDVANTISPMSAIIDIYQTGEVSSKAEVQKWVLAYGGAAIVTGLLLYGYNVMKSLGFRVTQISPSRGFCAELAASLVVVTASFVEIPVSSTQVIVGAVFGVGLVGGVKNVQWLFLLQVCCSWAGLFVCAATLSAGIFSYGAFSPSIN